MRIIIRKSFVGVLTVGALMSVAGTVAAGPLAPTRASDVVAVVINTNGVVVPCNGYAGSFAPSWISKSDGSSAAYSVPPKSVFVVTSMTFLASGRTPSRTANVQLTIVDAANPPSVDTPSVALAGELADASGNVSGHTVFFPTGFVIKPPAVPCVGFGGTGGTAILHGFFAKDK